MKKILIAVLTLLLTATLLLSVTNTAAQDAVAVDAVEVAVEVVSIPDANLAAALREALNLPTDAAITVEALHDLTGLWARGKGIADLTGLEYAINLTSLDLNREYVNREYQTNPITDISALANLTQLERLYLTGTAVSDVSALANLTQLTTLQLDNTRVWDMSALANLTKLTRLDLYSTRVSDVSTLANLTKLERLQLGSTRVSDVSALANLTQLTTLYLYSTGVSDVSALANLTQLTTLNLGDTNVSDVSALANLTQLTRLDLYSTRVSDVSAPAANLTQLNTLNLDGTNVSDVSALANLFQLTRLDLRNTNVSDVSALANLTQLDTLDLHGTNVSDVSALANLTQLTGLGLRNTNVSDVSALANLTQLDRLSLRDTRVSDVSALANLTQLDRLRLDGTDVSDVSALANLTQLTRLYLEGCQLSYASIHTHIPAMQTKGIRVYFDNVAYPALLKIAGDGQQGLSGTPLNAPLVVEAMDENGQPIVGKTILFENLQGSGVLSANTVETDARGRAQVTLTLSRVPSVNKVKASSAGIESWVLFNAIAMEVVGDATGEFLAADVNHDGVVDVADLGIVALAMGKPVLNPNVDANNDGVINIHDLLLVAAAFRDGADAVEPPAAGGDVAVAPSAHAASLSHLTAAEVAAWLSEAYAIKGFSSSLYVLHGIAVLEQLLANLMPKETVLLANYPNPFNPETWIPYRLAAAAEAQVSIYAADGKLVRRLELGQVPAGTYQSRSRAAYWDGRNAQGEPVASGVYFYTLTAGDFAATRKMLILK